MKFKLTNNGVFLLLAAATAVILAWGAYMAVSKSSEKKSDASAPAAGSSDVQNVGVGDTVDFVVRDAKGNIKK